MLDNISFLKLLEQIDDPDFQRFAEKVDDLSESNRIKFSQMVEKFKSMMSMPNVSAGIKGKFLEDLVHFLFEHSGKVYAVSRNIRTCTNEIDDLVGLTAKGKVLEKKGLLDFKGKFFLCECKNYNKSVGVTYVGKFCHLLQMSNCRLGIIFSYHGISGGKWSGSVGLTKKFHLLRERYEDKYYVISFDIRDFERIVNGDTLSELISEKCCELDIDTEFKRYLISHPAEDNL